MNKELARKLLPNVNDILVREAYEEYALYRISVLKDYLVNCTSWDEVLKTQGAIRELTRFSTLRDEVLSKKDEK